jgi:DNA-binding MarR family transcriptional regulator
MARRPEVTEPNDTAGEFPLHPAIYFLHLTHAISRYREARLDTLLRKHGADLAGFRALRALHRFSSATMGELADFTMIDRTTLTRVVDQLVENGLIGRSKFDGDRRKVVLKLTPEGRKVFAKARRVAADDVLGLMSGLPEAEVRAAVRLQAKIVARLGEPEPVTRRLLWLAPEKQRGSRRPAEPEATDEPDDAQPRRGR